MFITTPDFLAEHLAQLRTTKERIITAQAKGHTRLAEMNQRVTQQTEEVRKLRDQLARVHGDLRAATSKTPSTTQPPAHSPILGE